METDSIAHPLNNLSSTNSQSTHSQQQTTNNTSQSGITSTTYRNNEVRTVMLYGIPIIALVMDSQERLCLAQISNTLLKSFSYNEIHNRRVALGITCVQCTPVQLELLRRAGAMPVSSRRCGMITKREAERLCKSFLAETAPPKLPDSFSFDVYHQCAWGCRGSFTPSRYNSSRAKCIKCVYCGLFFSPNKFIFHSHRLPDSKYTQPDAANFNSWRRHIKLIGNPEPPDEVSYAWEDVKAMFNGGSRKRAMAAGLNSHSRHNTSNQEFLKRQSINSSSPESNQSLTPNTTLSDSMSPKSTSSAAPTYFPLIPLPNKYQLPSGVPFSGNPTIASSPPLKSLSSSHASDFRQSFAEFMWVGSGVGAGKPPALHIPYSCLLWPRPPTSSLDFSSSEANRTKLLLGSNESNGLIFPQREHLWPQESSHESRDNNNNNNNNNSHMSAFKPVAKSSAGNGSPIRHSFENFVKSPENSSVSPQPSQTNSDNDPEVDIIGEDGDESTPIDNRKDENTTHFESEKHSCVTNRKTKSYLMSENEVNGSDRKRSKTESTANNRHENMSLNFLGHLSEANIDERNSRTALDMCSTALDLRNLTSLTREELHQILMKQSEARLKSEREYDAMRETLEQQMRKEMVYREEVAKQLHLVRGMTFNLDLSKPLSTCATDALCQQLGNERTDSLSDHKLNESEESLHYISYKMKGETELGVQSLLQHYNNIH